MGRIKIELPENIIYTARVPIRITDLNYGNHVGNDSILSIFHEARVQMLKSMGYVNELGIEGEIGLIVSDVAIVYKSESFYGDVLDIHIGAADFSKYGFDLIYQALESQSEREVARGKTGMVCLDYKTRKVAGVPQYLINKLENSRS